MTQHSRDANAFNMTTLTNILAACIGLVGCGGGDGGEQAKTSTAAITPTGTSIASTEAAASAADVAASAASAPITGASAASAPAIQATAKHAAAVTPKAATATPTAAGPEITWSSTNTALPLSAGQGTSVANNSTVQSAPSDASPPPAQDATAAPLKQAAATTTAVEYTIGVYYFPGWSDNQRGASFAKPWDRIKPFPVRQPLLGWYSDSSPTVLRQQADQMRTGGIDFVIFDSYWDEKGPFMDHALKAYLSIWRNGDPKVAMLWANHFVWKGGLTNLKQMLDSWITNYLSKPMYLRIDNKPVLYIDQVEEFQNTARTLGITVGQLGSIVQQRAIAAGLPGIYMVGGTPGLAHWANVAVEGGFSALSAYNYHIGYSGEAATASKSPSNYASLTANYEQNWNWLLSKSTLPYFIPMSSGWDKSPWLDVTKAQTTYQAIATPDQFETHLRAAKSLMDGNPTKTKRIGVICCWNEFGEGSYVEPTKALGSQVLDRVKKVFGSAAPN